MCEWVSECVRELTIPGKAYDIGKKLIGRKGDARNHSQCLEEAVYEVRKEVKSGKVRKSSTRSSVRRGRQTIISGVR